MLAQHLSVRVGVAEDGLGQLQHERGRVEPGAIEGRRDSLQQPGVAELAHGQVHAQAKLSLTQPTLPAGRLTRRRLEHRGTDPADQAGTLSNGDELGRGHLATVAVRQPGERLDAHDAPVPQRVQRLVTDLEGVGVECRTDQLLDPGDLAGRGAGALGVRRPAALAVALRGVHRLIGLRDQLGRGHAGPVGVGDPDAGRQPHGLTADEEGAAQHLDDGPGEVDAASGIGGSQPRAHQHELVAGEPGDPFVAGQHVAQPPRRLLQQGVATDVPVHVVDELETVQVDEAAVRPTTRHDARTAGRRRGGA